MLFRKVFAPYVFANLKDTSNLSHRFRRFLRCQPFGILLLSQIPPVSQMPTVWNLPRLKICEICVICERKIEGFLTAIFEATNNVSQIAQISQID